MCHPVCNITHTHTIIRNSQHALYYWKPHASSLEAVSGNMMMFLRLCNLKSEHHSFDPPVKTVLKLG